MRKQSYDANRYFLAARKFYREVSWNLEPMNKQISPAYKCLFVSRKNSTIIVTVLEDSGFLSKLFYENLIKNLISLMLLVY